MRWISFIIFITLGPYLTGKIWYFFKLRLAGGKLWEDKGLAEYCGGGAKGEKHSAWITVCEKGIVVKSVGFLAFVFGPTLTGVSFIPWRKIISWRKNEAIKSLLLEIKFKEEKTFSRRYFSLPSPKAVALQSGTKKDFEKVVSIISSHLGTSKERG